MKSKASLNHTFRTVWSDAQQAFVVTAENVKTKGKKSASQQSINLSASVLTALSLTMSGVAFADPSGGNVTSGTATINQAGDTTTIQQTTQNVNIEWDSFNIEANETVNFHQPNATSLAVNNILDTNGSRIMGNLNANGQVWLINPNGVFFGQGAQVNVGSILASTLNPLNGTNTDGKQTFAGNGTGSIINQGNINANGGYVAFIANKVSNQGNIQANNGTVAMGAGSQVSLTFADNQLVNLTVDESTLNNLVENKQIIQADGGAVYMSAGARDSLLASVVNNEGKIQARTVQHKDGKIILMGGMQAGTTKVAGTLDASATEGDGGFIETSAADIQIADDVQVTTKADNGETGEWLIDPADFFINDSNSIGLNHIGAGNLQGQLIQNNIMIKTTYRSGSGSGNIQVNSAVTWTSNNTLTLESRYGQGGININKAITFSKGRLNLDAKGTITAAGAISGKTFDLQSGTWQQVGANLANFDVRDFRISGGTFIRAKGGNGASARPYQLTDVFGLQGVGSAGMLDRHYTLVNDIDASSTAKWNKGTQGPAKGFDPLGEGGWTTPKFEGTFDGLSHTVKDLTVNRPTEDFVGLFGYAQSATIRNVGVVGGDVTGKNHVGALVGFNSGTISNAYATGSVTGKDSFVGGLVGDNFTNGTISNAYATGSVTGKAHVGGLVGISRGRTLISNAYATGAVTGDNNLGGLVGLMNNSNISNVYATGTVKGSSDVGGLVGFMFNSSISNAYATGAVTGNSNTGGLVGLNDSSTINNSFYADTTNQNDSGKGVRKTTAQIRDIDTFTAAGWDIDDQGGTDKVWRIYDGQTGPLLRSFMTGLDLGTTTVSYNGNSQTAPKPVGADANLILGTGATGSNANTYSTNFYSTQQGYDLSNGDLVIEQAVVALDAHGEREYNGTNIFAANTIGLSGLQNGETLSLSGQGTVADKHVGVNKALDVSGVSLANGTGSASNYTFVGGTHTATITAKEITVDATADNKVYDGNKTAIVDELTSAGIISDDSVSFMSTAAEFDNKNAGTGKTVTVSGISKNGGADAGNYVVLNNTATTQADITPKSIDTVNAIASDKIYDSTKAATIALSSDDVISGDTVNFTAGSSRFNNEHAGNRNAVARNITISGSDAGNYTLNDTQASDVATISKLAIEFDATAADKVYDGNTDARITSLSTDGVIDGDEVSFSSTTGSFEDKHAGTDKEVSVDVTATGSDAENYVFNVKTEADITPKSINVSADAEDKVYDGNSNATVSLDSTGLVAGDDVDFSETSAKFNNRHAGTDKTVTVTGISASGDDADNYTFGDSTSTEADITAKTIVVEFDAADKTYDATMDAQASNVGSDDLLNKDTVGISYGDAAFDDKNVGTDKTVTLSDVTLTGQHAGNYQVVGDTTTEADISALEIEVDAVAYDKIYDGNKQATVDLDSQGILGSDQVSFSADANFNNKNAKDNKKVFVTNISASGADAGNYTFNNTAEDRANITRRAVDLSVTADDKVYDGDTDATLDTFTASNIIAGDELTITYTDAQFDDKNVGTDKEVTVSIESTGKDAKNYAVLETIETEADITPKTINVSAIAEDKTYDGNKKATIVDLIGNGVLNGDQVSFEYNKAKFDNKNAGDNKLVTVKGISATGDDAGNYAFGSEAVTAADIDQKAITLAALADNKIYDANRKATVSSLTTDDIVGNDDVSFEITKAKFDTKNVGTGKTVKVIVSADGSDFGNYVLVSDTLYALADITPKNVNVNALVEDKEYDGNKKAIVEALISAGIIDGDDVAFSSTKARFDNKNAGQDKVVTVKGISATGTDAGNYAFGNKTTTTADITPKAITVDALASDKIYDGNRKAQVDLSSQDIVSGDDINFEGKARFGNKHAGENKKVTVRNIAASGADAGNYSFNTQASDIANISRLAVDLDVVADNKVYDGNKTAMVSTLESAGILSGDEVSFNYSTAEFEDKNVGQDKKVEVKGIDATGSDARNYAFLSEIDTEANISKKSITVEALASDKVYDGNTDATVTDISSAGVIAGDKVNFRHSEADFDDKNVGVDKTVTVTGIKKSGADAKNYKLVNRTDTTEADITAKEITVDALAYNKIYDGNRKAQVDLSSQGIVSGDDINFDGKAKFGNKHAGENKKVTVRNIAASGADAGNYSFNTQASDIANISRLAVDLDVVADNKVYDGNKTAMVSTLESAGILSGDEVSFNYSTAEFEDKNVGQDKKVEVKGIDATGSDARNYAFLSEVDTKADITPKAIALDAHAQDKVYDGVDDATAELIISGLVSGDDVSFDFVEANFEDKHVGVDKQVTVAGINASGSDAGNYAYSQSVYTQADITPKQIILRANAADKVYDGTTDAQLGTTVYGHPDFEQIGVVAGDDFWFSFSNAQGRFSDKNVGQGKQVTFTGVKAHGADQGNYSFDIQQVYSSADITPKQIILRANAADKVYDGNNDAQLGTSPYGHPDFEQIGVVAGDSFWFSFSNAQGRFSDKNVGQGKQVKFTGVKAHGTDKGNYSYDIQHVYSTADITPKQLDLTVFAHDKVYDDNAIATLSGTKVSGVIAGDQAWVNDAHAHGWFDNKQVGSNKTVTFTGMQIDGADQANYKFEPTVFTTADIMQRQGYGREFLRNFKQYINAYIPEISAIILNQPRKMVDPLPLMQEEEQ